jgi:hypothetical protein
LRKSGNERARLAEDELARKEAALSDQEKKVRWCFGRRRAGED